MHLQSGIDKQDKNYRMFGTVRQENRNSLPDVKSTSVFHNLLSQSGNID